MKKYLYIILSTVLIFCLFLAGLSFKSKPKENDNIIVDVSQSRKEIINIYKDNDKKYLFLPSCAEEAIKADADVQVMKSENIPALFIDTVKGDFGEACRDKNKKMTVRCRIYDKDGNLTLDNAMADMNGRGSSTWLKEKKPFIIKFSKPQSVMGMKASKKWILLANSYDITNLRNKMVYDFGRDVMPGWTPSTEFADFYVDGVYQGTYLISEKVEVAAERLNIDNENGGLFSYTLASKSLAPLMTNNGQAVNTDYIKNGNKNDLKTIIDNVEEYIFCDDTISNDEDLFDKIDIDSWARRYLVDELFLNIDGGRISSYFYINNITENKRIFAGPIWDYDLIVGNDTINNAAERFGHTNWLLSSGDDARLYRQLMKNKIFKEYVRKLYINEYRDKLIYCINTYLPNEEKRITASSKMNVARWGSKLGYSADSNLKENQYIYNFLKERIEFLDKIWIDDIHMNIVKLQAPEIWRTLIYFVEDGGCLDKIGDLKNLDKIINEKTGEKFSLNQPITEDMELKIENITEEVVHTRKKEMLLVLVLMFLAMLAVVFADILIQKKEESGFGDKK